MISCELDITYTTFHDTKILTYGIELPPYGNKVGFNLLDYEDFKIPYITDTIKNSPDGHQLPTQVKKNVWIIDINGEEPIKSQGTLDELNLHQTPRGKSKFNISLFIRKRYQRTYLEDSSFRFDQVRPVVLNL